VRLRAEQWATSKVFAVLCGGFALAVLVLGPAGYFLAG
jgi:hypothetical protein